MGTREYGFDPGMLARIADEIDWSTRLASSCAWYRRGNIFRGVSGVPSDGARLGRLYGMLATVINSLAVQNELEQRGVTTRVQSRSSMQAISPYIRRRALRHLEKGRV